MSKVATDFMNRHKWTGPKETTSGTPLSELAKYSEEIGKCLKDRKARASLEHASGNWSLLRNKQKFLFPILPSGKYEEGRDTIDKIAKARNYG